MDDQFVEDRQFVKQYDPSFAAFLIALGLGVAWILASKGLGLSQLVVTGVPVLLIVTYALLLFIRERGGTQDDRAADGLYYLGVLYTLVSLARSLYEFGSESVRTRDIIENFGIALATTIVGMGLRVAFQQLLSTPAELEEQLNKSSQLVQTQLQQTGRSFADAARDLRTCLQEAVSELKGATTQMLEAVSDMTQSARGMGVVVDDNTKSMREQTSTLNLSADQTVKAVKTLAETVEKQLGKMTAELATKLKGFDDTVGEILAQEKTRANAATSQFEALKKTLEVTEDSAKRLRGGMEAMKSEADALRAPIQASLNAFAELLASVRSSTSSYVAETQKDVKAIREHRAELKGEAQAVRETLREVYTALGSLADVAVKQVRVSQIHAR